MLFFIYSSRNYACAIGSTETKDLSALPFLKTTTPGVSANKV